MNNISIKPMTIEHVKEVHEIEMNCFPIPWSEEDFKREIAENKIYFVAIDDEDKILGFAGMWHVVNEGHITNVAVLEEFRKNGVGSALIEALIEAAKKKEMIGITLEVRISNTSAQRLYTRYGFKPEGIRKNYYAETKEDGIIMWKYFEK